MKWWNWLKEMWSNPPSEPTVPPQPVSPPMPASPTKPAEPPQPSLASAPSGASLSQWHTFGRNTPYEKAEVVFTHPEKGIRRVIVSSGGFICDFPGIAENVPAEYASIASDASISFRTDFERCPDGKIKMIWEIQPDGRYWEDEDGYGGTADEEVTLWTMIDENGCFTGPFRPYRIGVRRMDSWEMRQAENALAENRMEDAKRWYPEAARQGIVEAQYQAGLLLRQEPEEAFAWMQKAADSRMPEAMEMLGRYYAECFGCTPNAANAAYWADAAKKYR